MVSPWLPSAKTRHTKTLPERIDDALNEHGGPMDLRDLEAALYPNPRSHRYQSNGGPPGCRMAVSAALRRGGFTIRHQGGNWGNQLVVPRKPIVNPDFLKCEGCDGEFYKGDLTGGLCEFCGPDGDQS